MLSEFLCKFVTAIWFFAVCRLVATPKSKRLPAVCCHVNDSIGNSHKEMSFFKASRRVSCLVHVRKMKPYTYMIHRSHHMYMLYICTCMCIWQCNHSSDILLPLLYYYFTCYILPVRRKSSSHPHSKGGDYTGCESPGGGHPRVNP